KMRRKQEKALRTLQERLQTLPRLDEVEALDMQIVAQKGTCAERETAVAETQAEHVMLQARLLSLETKLSAVQITHQELDASRAAQQRMRDSLAERLQTLPRPVEVEALQEQVARLCATIAEKQATAAELSCAPEEVARQEQVLAALGNPRQAYQGASAIAKRRGVIEEQHSQAEQQRVKHTTSRKELEAALSAYAGLDNQLLAMRAALTEHTPAYQRYQEHIREAEAVAERQVAVKMLTEQVAMAEAAHAEQVALRDAVAREYDAETYAQIAAQYAALGQELAGLKAQLQEQRKQQTGLQAEIARLNEVQARLSKIRTEHAEHRELLTLLEHLRHTLRDAGPEITKALVEVISLQADQLYADIMQDYSARLRWTDDYDIILNTEGRVRSFQQLSGGEQMAAALAVRLALLREISAIDVAFFDEPTANLDRDRRANLAAQILNVKGFTQLFVISHDDTFEEDTDHVVHIVKRNGSSAIDMEARA
ncbi:MAG: AAA family ATPase, partial [Anaerolineae bacterium]|nr:AAA family ATPase [Anaerolineae bacterium]